MFAYEVNIDLVNAERGRGKHRDTGECFPVWSLTSTFNSRPDESANRETRDEKKKRKSHIAGDVNRRKNHGGITIQESADEIPESGYLQPKRCIEPYLIKAIAELSGNIIRDRLCKLIRFH